MKVYRLCREKYASDFSGKGAALSGARWNSKGTELIYTSESRALAMAEVSVHLSLDLLPDDFIMLEILIPDNLEQLALDQHTLPRDWNQSPPMESSQLLGDKFVSENKFCILRVPSAVVRGDHNLLINPHHPDFSKIKITAEERFPFDRRLFGN